MVDRSPVRVLARRDPMLVAGVLLIALQTVVRALVVLPSYYWQDDFIHMEAAGRLGLSRAFVVKDHNGHLEMGTNLVYWLIGRDAGPSFLPAALTLLGMQVVASALLLAVLRQLFGRSPWVLVPFAGYLFTPLALPAATWWAAGLEAMPLQITMLTAVLGLVRALRTHSWRWATVSVAGSGTGLFFWEKAALIVPTLLVVVVLVEWAGQPLGRRLRQLWASWPYLVPHGVLLAGYLVVYAAVVDPPDVPLPDTGTLVSRTGETVFRMLVPGLLGGPWTGAGAENTTFPAVGTGLAVLAAALAAGLVLLSVWLRGARALQGWLLVTGYVAVDVALMVLGRGDYLHLIARDPRYVTDALPVVAIGVCAAFSGPLLTRARHRPSAPVASPLPVALVTGVLVAGCLLSSSLLAPELQHRETREYVAGVLRAVEADPDASVVNSRLPGSVVMASSADVAVLLRAVGSPRRLDEPGTDLRMFDGEGDLRPITLLEPQVQPPGPFPDCGWSAGAEEQWIGDVVGGAPGPVVLRLGYLTDRPTALHVAVGGDEQVLTVPPGYAQAFFVVTGLEGPVTARVSGVPEGTVCLSGVMVGTPWPAAAP